MQSQYRDHSIRPNDKLKDKHVLLKQHSIVSSEILLILDR